MLVIKFVCLAKLVAWRWTFFKGKKKLYVKGNFTRNVQFNPTERGSDSPDNLNVKEDKVHLYFGDDLLEWELNYPESKKIVLPLQQ